MIIMLLIIIGINRKITKETDRPTSKPLVTPPSKYEKVGSTQIDWHKNVNNISLNL